MSGKDEPTLGDVLRVVTDLCDRMDRLAAVVAREDEQLTELRVVAMERMDRLQNTVAKYATIKAYCLGCSRLTKDWQNAA